MSVCADPAHARALSSKPTCRVTRQLLDLPGHFFPASHDPFQTSILKVAFTRPHNELKSSLCMHAGLHKMRHKRRRQAKRQPISHAQAAGSRVARCFPAINWSTHGLASWCGQLSIKVKLLRYLKRCLLQAVTRPVSGRAPRAPTAVKQSDHANQRASRSAPAPAMAMAADAAVPATPLVGLAAAGLAAATGAGLAGAAAGAAVAGLTGAGGTLLQSAV